MDLGSRFDHWAFPTVIILITVHRPSIRGGWAFELRTICSLLYRRCFEWSIFDSPKFSHQTISTVQTASYYTIMRYILLEIYFSMVSNPDRITQQQMFFSIVWDISLWSNQWWVSSSPTPSSSIFRKYFNISQAQYQSIHEEKSLINIYFYYSSASIFVPVLYILSTILDANSIKFESIPKMSSDNIRLAFASCHWWSWHHRFEAYDLMRLAPSDVLYTLWTPSRP